MSSTTLPIIWCWGSRAHFITKVDVLPLRGEPVLALVVLARGEDGAAGGSDVVTLVELGVSGVILCRPTMPTRTFV
jgi:hypothetical protein